MTSSSTHSPSGNPSGNPRERRVPERRAAVAGSATTRVDSRANALAAESRGHRCSHALRDDDTVEGSGRLQRLSA
jgi:hypothetical protein